MPTREELKAELNCYDPPSKTQAFVWFGVIAVLAIVAIVLSVLYGWGVFD